MTQDTQQLSVRRGLSKMTKDPNDVGFEFLDPSNSMAFDGLLSTLSARRNNARLKRNKTIFLSIGSMLTVEQNCAGFVF